MSVGGAAKTAVCGVSIAVLVLVVRAFVDFVVSFVENPDSEEARRSARGTRAAAERRDDFDTGEDGGVFSGLATTTFCLEEVCDLVGVLGASSNALMKVAIEG